MGKVKGYNPRQGNSPSQYSAKDPKKNDRGVGVGNRKKGFGSSRHPQCGGGDALAAAGEGRGGV